MIIFYFSSWSSPDANLNIFEVPVFSSLTTSSSNHNYPIDIIVTKNIHCIVLSATLLYFEGKTNLDRNKLCNKLAKLSSKINYENIKSNHIDPVMFLSDKKKVDCHNYAEFTPGGKIHKAKLN